MAAPTINISEPIGLTNVETAEATTNFAGFRHSGGGSPSLVSEVNVFVQGSAAVSAKVSGSARDEGIWATNVGSVDMTTDANKHAFIWGAMIDMAQVDTRTAGGFYLIVASSTTNWNKYYVSGNDIGDTRFVRYVLDVTKTPSETSATPATLTAVTHIGIGVKGTITAKAENLIIDRIDYGTGLQIEDGDATTPASWRELFDDDDLSANKYGIIENRSGIFFLKGGLQIGDGSGTKTSLWLDDSGAIAQFENPVYDNGAAVVSSIDASTLYKINLVGNGTGTTDITFGQVIGTGDDRQGLNGGTIGSDGPKWSLDGETDIADLDTVNLYGMTIRGAGTTQFSGSTKSKLIGCTFINCDEVQPNDAEWLNNTIAAPVPDRGLEIISTHEVKQTTLVSGISGSSDTRPATRCWQVDVVPTPASFVEMTDEFASAATGDVVPFPATEAIGDYFAIGSDRIFRAVTIDVGTARSGGTLAFAYWNGSGWPGLTLSVDDTDTLATTGSNITIFNPPADWAKLSLQGEDPLYYIRLVVTATMTTNPILDEGEITEIEEHLLHYPAAFTDTVDAVVCLGAAVHVENSAAGVTEDNYSFTNQNTTAILGASTFIGRGQSFTGAGGVLSSVRVQMSKDASTDVADMVCKVYAHSGTFGTSSIPTGAALATSNTISTSELSELGVRNVQFEFEDEFTLVNTTKYVVTWEVAAVFASGKVNVGADNTSPTHAGNASFLIGSTWAAGTADLPFVVTSGAILTLNLTNGSVIDTDQNTELTNPGATIINDNLSITFTDLIVNSEVRVYLAGTSTEVDGIESTVGSTFNFSVASGVAVDYVILGPIVGNLAYVPIRVESISWTAATTIVVNQQVNRNFSNP